MYSLHVPLFDTKKKKQTSSGSGDEADSADQENQTSGLPAKVLIYFKCDPLVQAIKGKVSSTDPKENGTRKIEGPTKLGSSKMWSVDQEQLMRIQEDLDVEITSTMEVPMPQIGCFSGKFVSHENEAILYSKIKVDQNLFTRKTPLNKEFIFLIDRSGSMHGDFIRKAKASLKLAVQVRVCMFF